MNISLIYLFSILSVLIGALLIVWATLQLRRTLKLAHPWIILQKKALLLVLLLSFLNTLTALILTILNSNIIIAIVLGVTSIVLSSIVLGSLITNSEAAEQLNKQKRKFEALIENGQDCVIILDKNIRPIYVSKSMKRMLGYEPEEVLNIDIMSLIHPEDAPLVVPVLETAIAKPGQSIPGYTSRVQHKDGSWRYLEATVTNFLEEPSINGIVDNFHDVTDRVIAQQRLKEINQRLILAANATKLGIWDYHIGSGVLLWDDGMHEIYGLPKDSFEETIESWISFVHSDDKQAVFELMEQAKVGKSEFDTEFRIIQPNQTVRHIKASAILEFDQEERPLRLVGTNLDISSSKLQLTRLDLLNQITKAIAVHMDLQSISQVVVQRLEDQLPVDFAMMVLLDERFDKTYLQSLGKNSREILKNIDTEPLNQSGSVGEFFNSFQYKLEYKKDISQIEIPFFKYLSTVDLKSVVISPLSPIESDPLGFIICARKQANGFDDTDCDFLGQLGEHVSLAVQQAELNHELQAAYNDLKRTQEIVLQQERLKALGQMASGIAHDINNAISPVVLYLDTLLETEKGLSPKGRSSLDVIQRAIDDVAQTVARMGEFYRNDQSKMALTNVELKPLIDQVVELTKAKWLNIPQQNGVVIQMKTKIATDSPLIQGIESELREALTNLVFNAVDALPDGGTINLEARIDKVSDLAVLEVRDTGMGMSEETRRKCLEPFYTTKGERGTGLGLAMVYGIVKRHNGQIEIESEPEKGTSFILKFPAIKQSQEKESLAILPIEKPQATTVLVVDDDPVLLESLIDILEDEGHQVVGANGGQKGIDAFHLSVESGSPYDIVITDLGMPGIDGSKVAEAVKKAQSKTKVIMLTGWGQRIIDKGQMKEVVDLVLSKPPKLKELRNGLQAMISDNNT